LVYGHYDKVTLSKNESWSVGNGREPIMKDGKLYGRGGVDDGYSYMAISMAIARAYESGGVNMSNLYVFLEGDEESGSPDFEYWLKYA